MSCMWIRRWVLLMVYLVAAPSVGAQAPAGAIASADETAIRAVIEKYVNARDARDPAAVEAMFTADADQYTTGGDWRRGRERVVAGTAESTKQNPGDRSISVAAVRFITPDVAIADGAYNIAGSDVRRWTTIVLKRESGAWRISAIRNMTPTGAAARGTPAAPAAR
jgi:uncharacterized protein (TIGR02246 family)